MKENNVDTFNITMNSKIVLYGGGFLAKKCLRSLGKNGYTVVCMFDKNADKIVSEVNVPIYCLSEPVFTPLEKKKLIVIVCVHNALWHCEIVDSLETNGYENILFLPDALKLNAKDSYIMKKKYACFYAQRYEELEEIPNLTRCRQIQYDCADAVISENQLTVTAWVNTEIIYTGKGVPHLRQVEKKETLSTYLNLNLPAAYPYIEMFRYIESGNGDYAPYITLFKNLQSKFDECSEQDFLEDRAHLYGMLKEQLIRGTEYFQLSPVAIERSNNAFFTIWDGHHRGIFLYLHDFIRIPAMMTKEDFMVWCNVQKLDETLQFMEKNNITEIDTPVPHPAFYHFPVKRERYGKTVLATIQEFIGNRSLEGCAVADISEYNSYFARNFLRMGVTRAVSIEEDEKKYQLALLLNKLLYIEGMELHHGNVERIGQLGQFDIVCITGKIGKLLLRNPEDCRKFVLLLEQVTTGILIWESGTDALQEKDFILANCQLKFYHKLHSYNTGKYVAEVGIFSASESLSIY